MRKRRATGEGTVYKAPNGRWIAMIELARKPDGKRQRKLKRAQTKAQAQRLLNEMRDEYRQNGRIASPGKRTVNDAIDTWYLYRKAEPIDLGTLDHDRWVNGVISQGLGQRQLAKLTLNDCEAFLTDCSKGAMKGRNPIGRSHLTRTRRRLVQIVDNEIRIGNLTQNVAERSKLPFFEQPKKETKPDKSQSTKRRALSTTELNVLVRVADNAWTVLVDLVGRNALRPAEARSLRWSEIDLDARELKIIGQQNKYNKRTDTKKAKNSTRTILIDQVTFEVLSEWQTKQKQLIKQTGQRWSQKNPVASTSVKPIDRYAFAKAMRSLSSQGEINPPAKPYDLRHTAISMQADAGRSSWEIADWAGTSETMINKVYRHRLRRVSNLTPIQTETQEEEPRGNHLGNHSEKKPKSRNKKQPPKDS